MKSTTPRRTPQVWMNVTTSVNWRRPPVGIVRVEQALAHQLREQLGPERFRLCVWQDDRFVEWVAPPVDISPQIEQAADSILPRSASFDLARPFVMRALRKFSKPSVVAQSGPAELHLAVPTSMQAGLHPRRGDILISVGLDWDNEYTERFYDLATRDGLRIVTCCYDLIPVLFPHYCVGEVAQKFTEYFLQLTWGSEAVLCISKQTQADYTQLCRELGAPQRQTVVIPLGDSVPSETGSIGAQVNEVTSGSFILFVSTIERRKNHEVLYRAYHLLARQGHASILPKLVFVGMPGWGIGDLMKDIELDPLTRGLIVQLHHVNDNELNHLYQQALFCVYPSLYEGWGLPVGEALAMGKAILSSAEGSLPEVGGDLVRYLPPWNAHAWADAVLELVQEPDLVRQMEAKVREGYHPREWVNTARTVKSLIEGMINSDADDRTTLLPGYDLRTEVGVRVGPRVHSTGIPGLLLLGPHRKMSRGAYCLRVYARGQSDTTVSLDFEVRSAAGQASHYRQTVVVTPARNTVPIINFDFELRDDVSDFEIKCVIDASASFSIERIEIDRVEKIDSEQLPLLRSKA